MWWMPSPTFPCFLVSFLSSCDPPSLPITLSSLLFVLTWVSCRNPQVAYLRSWGRPLLHERGRELKDWVPGDIKGAFSWWKGEPLTFACYLESTLHSSFLLESLTFCDVRLASWWNGKHSHHLPWGRVETLITMYSPCIIMWSQFNT